MDPTLQDNIIPNPEPAAPQEMQAQAQQVSVIDQIDKDELSKHILDLLRTDIRDREDFGWTLMREYDQLSYEGYKRKATEPWHNASNFAVCLTPTLVDTAHANIVGGIFADPERVINARGVGPEDVRTEKHVETLMNWQTLNDIEDFYDTVDKTVHVALKHGNAVVKVIQGYGGPQKNKVICVRVPMENVFLPVNARGAQVGQTDHIFELIPLTENEKKQRETLKDAGGKPAYEGIKDLQRGNRVLYSSAIDAITNVKDITGGTSLGRKYSTDMYYIVECYLTYYFTPKGSEDCIPVELIVWIAPQGGKIMRMVENGDVDEDTSEAIRPYSLRWCPYPREDRIYGQSLPWMIKQTQEELDYAHNQNMNAADELIKPYKFYDPASGFDPEAHQQTPNGWYPIPNPRQNVYIPDMRFDPIFERQFERYWEYAQRRTGLTELFQGRSPDHEQTLGEAQLRVNKTEIRFKTVYDRFEQGFKELVTLIYFYDKKYMPMDTKVKVLGATEYQSIKELFPDGIKGRYNFSFTSSPITEKAKERANTLQFYSMAAMTPLVINSPAAQWKLLEMAASSLDIRDIEALVAKPPQANILSPQEAIQRIMSGQFDVMPDPGIDVNDYNLRIQMFMKSDAFRGADPVTQQAVMLLARRVEKIRQGQQMAVMDAQILREKMMIEAHMGASMGGGPMGPGGGAGGPSAPPAPAPAGGPSGQ